MPARLVALLLTVLLSQSGWAQDKPKEKPKIDKTQAAQTAKQQVGGRVLKVDQTNSKYKVKMLKKSGRVVSVDVDKQSGKVSQNKKKDGNK